MESKKHLLSSHDDLLCFSVPYETLLYCPEINLEDGKLFDGCSYGANAIFHEVFKEEISSGMCLFTGPMRRGSNMLVLE